jgi:hypothetical protein
MAIWVGAVVLIVIIAGFLTIRGGGKANRTARRELRQLRKESGWVVNHEQISEHRRTVGGHAGPPIGDGAGLFGGN